MGENQERPMESVKEILGRYYPEHSKIASMLSSGPGITVGDMTEVYACSICRDFGKVHPRLTDGKVDYSRVVACVCQSEAAKERRAVELRQYCRMPFGAEHMTFQSFRPSGHSDLIEAYNMALALAQETEGVKWLTLMAKAGRGKTHLALAVCHEWFRRGKVARYAFVPLLLKELRDGFDQQGESSYSRLFDTYCTVPLLVLDDLGVENPTKWAQEQLQTIVHYRGINGLPLMVTTNHGLDDLVGDAEHRIGSRLRRESWCRVIAIEAPEYRASSIPPKGTV